MNPDFELLSETIDESISLLKSVMTDVKKHYPDEGIIGVLADAISSLDSLSQKLIDLTNKSGDHE